MIELATLSTWANSDAVIAVMVALAVAGIGLIAGDAVLYRWRRARDRRRDPAWDRARRTPRLPLLLVRAWTWRKRRRIKNHYTAMPDHTGRPLSDKERARLRELERAIRR